MSLLWARPRRRGHAAIEAHRQRICLLGRALGPTAQPGLCHCALLRMNRKRHPLLVLLLHCPAPPLACLHCSTLLCSARHAPHASRYAFPLPPALPAPFALLSCSALLPPLLPPAATLPYPCTTRSATVLRAAAKCNSCTRACKPVVVWENASLEMMQMCCRWIVWCVQ